MREKKPQSHHLLLLTFLAFFVVVVRPQTQPDCEVMLGIRSKLTLPKGYWEGNDCCDNTKWVGVQCDTTSRVVRIQLKDRDGGPITVTGQLPDTLKDLPNLQHLEFRGENIEISGPLPTLSGLSQLQVVLLSENNFSSIPRDFFQGLSSLQGVFLDQLPLSPWSIPDSLSTCSALRNFSAAQAGLVGNIPGLFNSNNFAALVELHLGSNMLEGELPKNFSTLTTLQSLWLNGQNLSGGLDVLKDMTSLEQVWLNKNSFTGPLPDFSNLTALSDFNVRDNRITGPVPPSLQTLPGLRVVNLSNNYFQGPFPKFGDSVQVDLLPGSTMLCSDKCSENTEKMLAITSFYGYPESLLPTNDLPSGNNSCTWPVVTCRDGDTITVINFHKKGLSGTISPLFADIKSLETINLADNQLSGPIPKELTTLPSLRVLDVSNNKLSGQIPPFKAGVLKVEGNPDIGKTVPVPVAPGAPPRTNTSNSPPGSSDKKSGMPVGGIVGLVVGGIGGLLVILVLGYCCCKSNHKSDGNPNAMVVHPHHSGSDPDMVKITVAGSNVSVGAASESHSHTSSGPSDIQMVEAGNMVIKIQVLRQVTNNFSEENVLGRGGFGTVYKGQFEDGTVYAVKRMESGVMGAKGLAEFKSEIDVLNKVRHRHLVSLNGYCLDGNERILVYEYMPKGTLSQHLFNWKDEGLKPLGWTRRLTIALDVARGVEYLHGLASQSFIHRDLKPSNILLGDDMRAKVADFGLVRLAPEGKNSIETRLAGTFGYLAPEYAATGRVTTKVDVYAFGVILMELITGRKALDESQPEESMHLVTWFRRMNINKDTARKAIDPTIDVDEESLASISTVAELAGYCCSREPHQRPDMGHVVNVLSSLVELWKPTDADPEDIYAIDMELSLAQTLKKWQAFDGNSSMDRDSSSFLASVDNTQTSIPTRPSGFADSFTSADGR